MPKNLDPFWEYAEPVDPQNRQKLRCNMCGKEMTGGISRLKYHLAQLAKLAIEGIGKRKDEREALRQELGMRATDGRVEVNQKNKYNRSLAITKSLLDIAPFPDLLKLCYT